MNISKLPKGMKVPAQFNPNKVLGYDENSWDKDVYEKLPQFMKDKIKVAPQYAPCLGLVSEDISKAFIKGEETPF